MLNVIALFLRNFRDYITKVGGKCALQKSQKTLVKKSQNNNYNNTNFNIKWTDQQIKVFDAIGNKQSVFITGSAGTGKTMLVMVAISLLKELYPPIVVSVTASTGIAACAIGGQTLHSFAGIGLGEANADVLLNRIMYNRMALKRWKTVEALVIDEISMIGKDLFDKLDYIARMIKGNDEPWGGIQLVVGGDFLQLPPVDIFDKDVKSDVYNNIGCSKGFAFEADCWDNCFQLQVCLDTVFRQTDPQLVKLLQCIRKGEVDDEGLELIESCWCVDEPDETVVRLFPRVADVTRVNEMRLKSLGEEIIVYEAFDQGKKPWVDQLERGIAPSTLQLCIGARVMLVVNLKVKEQLVNGAAGTIIGFQMVFGSVGLKRICDRLVLPVVKFDSGCEMLIEPFTWEVEVENKVCARRLQIPLVLAWAMSIHKSQGMTLDRLHTNLSKAFGFGMIYVALSRIRTLDGLSFSSDFDLSKIKAHPKVLEYYHKHFE